MSRLTEALPATMLSWSWRTSRRRTYLWVSFSALLITSVTWVLLAGWHINLILSRAITDCIVSFPVRVHQVAHVFDVQLVIVDYKSIICPGFTAVMHIHACVQEVRFRSILCRIDRKTNEKTDIRPRFIKQDDVAIVRFEVSTIMIRIVMWVVNLFFASGPQLFSVVHTELVNELPKIIFRQ